MTRDNHVWIMEVLARGRWVPTLAITLSSDEGNRTLSLWRSVGTDYRFRLTKYVAIRAKRMEAMSEKIEYCFICGEPTGRAGRAEDSIYSEEGKGPYCEGCWGKANALTYDELLEKLVAAEKDRDKIRDERNAQLVEVANRDERIAELTKERDGLAEVAEKLPKTADGKTLWPGEYVCRRSGFTDYIFESLVDGWVWQETFDDLGTTSGGEWWISTVKPRHWSHPYHDCYSTRQAALAARRQSADAVKEGK